MSRIFVVSRRACDRRSEVVRRLATLEASAPVLVVAPTMEVGTELVRESLAEGGARFGTTLWSLGRLAASLAAAELARRGVSPGGALALEAVMSAVVHELAERRELGRFAVVAGQPGLPVALSRTVQELRLARADVAGTDPDLARVAAAFDAALERTKLADRALVFSLAAKAAPSGAHLFLVDVDVEHEAAADLVAALAAGAPSTFACAPKADERGVARLARALGTEPKELDGGARTAVARAARSLFSEAAEAGEDDGSVVVLSAPGDDREAVEIARRIHREAEAGVPFDRMAVLVRSPHPHRAHLAEALRRAGIPAHMALGTRRPDPSGRAFLALVACKEEDHSARRFAEYVSLGETPRLEDGAPAPPPKERTDTYVAPDDDAVPAARTTEPPPPDELVVGPRTPHRWERILVANAVIRGVDRWRSRLAHRRKKLEDAAAKEEDEGRRALLAERDDILHLERFAIPLLEELDRLPERATWGVWKAALERLADRALRRPERVRAVLSELSPMADVGPVTLSEVRAVLAPRLSDLLDRPEGRKEGAVLVGTTDAARGRSLDVVFVAGLSERLFPRKVTEDAVLSDVARKALGDRLPVQADRAADERTALALAVGAAERRLYVSYSRIDTEQRRQRTPSFYALEVLRAATGTLPSFDDLSRRAEVECDARLAWPAPQDPAQSIDVAEYDLATLRLIDDKPTPEKVGLARYLLLESQNLRRSLRGRAARGQGTFMPEDGLFRPSDAAKAALAAHQPETRSFSPTAAQSYAICPYKFYLYTILRLRPRETVERLDELDALERGSFTHEVLFRLNVALRAAGLLPIQERTRRAAADVLEKVLADVEVDYRERHDPPVRRVWDDGIQAIRADLREWLRRKVEEADVHPTHFELAFGLTEEDDSARDAASVDAPVTVSVGLTLRGSIDLVERTPEGLVATDYKTGKQRAKPGCVIGGGETLQPVFYALVLEAMFPTEKITGGRLYYCTFAGDFQMVPVVLDDVARDAAKLVADTLRGALREGSFPARPREDGCTYCDFVPVCGAGEERRTRNKPRIVPLEKLRKHP